MVNIKVPAGLGLPMMARVVEIVQSAARNPDGTLTSEGARYICDTIAAEFGEDLADSVMSGETVEFDYSSKKPS
jgi:hypothetical protein